MDVAGHSGVRLLPGLSERGRPPIAVQLGFGVRQHARHRLRDKRLVALLPDTLVLLFLTCFKLLKAIGRMQNKDYQEFFKLYEAVNRNSKEYLSERKVSWP